MIPSKTDPILPHPLQPLVYDEHKVLRFRANKIVKYLFDHGDLNFDDLADMDFSGEDRKQFAQLIGYSLSGFSNRRKGTIP